ncbi:MAG: LysR family transcriptional regulator [Minwuiales bacterium]|nr:LysR family transcriptional regulator [Minwuiales bacterium]
MHNSDLQNVDLKLLRVFMTVARENGFSAAQSVLNVGQSTISIQIANLEERLGMTLCQRGRGGFALTEEGKKVFDAAQGLFTHIDDFRSQVASINDEVSGLLSVGVIDNTMTNPNFRLSDAIRLFKQRNRRINIDVHIVPPNTLAQMIMDGRVHIAMGYFPHHPAKLHWISVFNTDMALYCGRGHPLFGLPDSEIDCETVARCEHAKRGYVSTAQMPETHRAFNFTAQSYNIEGLAHLVLSGCFLAFLPCHHAEQWVARGEMRSVLPDLYGYQSRYEIAWRKSETSMAATTQFIDCVRQVTGLM